MSKRPKNYLLIVIDTINRKKDRDLKNRIKSLIGNKISFLHYGDIFNYRSYSTKQISDELLRIYSFRDENFFKLKKLVDERMKLTFYDNYHMRLSKPHRGNIGIELSKRFKSDIVKSNRDIKIDNKINIAVFEFDIELTQLIEDKRLHKTALDYKQNIKRYNEELNRLLNDGEKEAYEILKKTPPKEQDTFNSVSKQLQDKYIDKYIELPRTKLLKALKNRTKDIKEYFYKGRDNYPLL